MDIFGADIDSFYNELNENVREDDVEDSDGEDKEDDEGEAKKDEAGEPIKVEPKKRSVRRPRVSNKSLAFFQKKTSFVRKLFLNQISDAFECGPIEVRPWNSHARKLL